MPSSILSRRKWKLNAHGQHIVIVKGTQERFSHPLMKAFLWALYLPQYPNITVEVSIGDKYKPDVIAFESDDILRAGKPLFWGEAGQVGLHKIESIARRYRDTHFAIARWNTPLDSLKRIVSESIDGLGRRAPFDLISFPEDSAERFIDEDGLIWISHEDVNWQRLG